MKIEQLICDILKILDNSSIDLNTLSAESLGVSDSKRSSLITHMLNEGLIDGYREVKVDGAPYVIYVETVQGPNITIKGERYLENTSNL